MRKSDTGSNILFVMTTEEGLEKLRAIAQNKKVLILTHNNPDPDAISAGWALSYLLRKKFKAICQLAYGGLIARAENRAIVRLLNIDIRPLDSLNICDFQIFALVDTQPRAGNNGLPPHIKASIVIDHHGVRKSSQEADFVDIRIHYGSSATIATEYLLRAGLFIPKTMATALFYGIKTDTRDLGRHATAVDYNAAIALYPKVQLKILSQIEYPDLPQDYFIDFDRGLHEAEIYGKVIFCDLGFLRNPDMVALMAGFFLLVFTLGLLSIALTFVSAFSVIIFLTSRFLNFLRATNAAFLSPLGLNFPFSQDRIAPVLVPVRIPSSLMDMPSFFLSPRILSGVRRDAFTSSGVASSFGLASSRCSSLVILFMELTPLERLDSLSLMALTSLRSGIKVDRISRLAKRWISDLMVDSSLPMVASSDFI